MSVSYTFESLFNGGFPLEKGDEKKEASSLPLTVVVPRIQRPYAQGRKDEKSKGVRRKFLEDLFSVLWGEKPDLDLNFIYGKVEKKGNGYEMQLLDGQQRFTTLFLLHWYLIIREKVSKEGRTGIVKGIRSFKYETRDTSSSFCEILGNFLPNGDDDYIFTFSRPGMVTEKGCNEHELVSPSNAIKNSLQYVHSFDLDPTVDAMLTMLDEIDSKYNDIEVTRRGRLWENLGKIQFCVLPLTEYKLSEELYIKMNARGLRLSTFECFKSDFLALMDADKLLGVQLPRVDVGSGLPVDANVENAVSLKQYFAIKLDSSWCDLFWNSDYPEEYDEAYMLFFSRYFLVRFILESNKSDQSYWRRINKDEQSDFYALIHSYEENRAGYYGFTPFENLFKEYARKGKEYYTDIRNVLELLKRNKCGLIHGMIPLWEIDNPEQISREQEEDFDYFCVCRKENNTRREPKKLGFSEWIRLSAVISFLHYFPEFPLAIFTAWMKAVNCVIENTDVSSIEICATTARKLEYIVNSVSNLKPESEVAFYRAMSKLDKKDFSAAIGEEIDKASRIAEDEQLAPQWISLFDDIMRNKFLKGTIGFYYSEKMSFPEFSRQFKLIESLINSKGICDSYRGKDHDYILLRAILSRIVSWGELDGKYITEKHDSEKHLKNLLMSNRQPRLKERIKELFANRVFNALKDDDGDIQERVIKILKSEIANAPRLEIEEGDGWDRMESLSVLRDGKQNFYHWVTDDMGDGIVCVKQNPKKNNQIQARREGSCVMIAVFRYVHKLAEEFKMDKKPIRKSKKGPVR